MGSLRRTPKQLLYKQTLNPEKILDTEKTSGVLTLDPGGDDAEMKMSTVPTVNPGKIF